MFVTNKEPMSSRMSAWHSALQGQLAAGGAGASLLTLGPRTVLEEIGNTCEAILAGHGATNEDDRASLANDAYDMCRGLGPSTVKAIGAALNSFRGAVGPKQLSTGTGSRAVSLAAQVLTERLCEPEVAAAAWDDVVQAFEDAAVDAELGEHRIMVLRELCELRGHVWSDFGGLAELLSGLLNDSSTSAAHAGAIDAADTCDPRSPAGFSESRRRAICREAVAADAERGDVVVWLLFAHAWVDFWQPLGPVQLFNVGLVPEGAGAGGPLEQIEGYVPPRELADWEEASTWLGHLELPDDVQGVLVRVSLTDTAVGQAPARARDLLEGLIEVAEDHSGWVLCSGESVYRDKAGWYGSRLRFDLHPEAVRRGSQHPAFDSTPAKLRHIGTAFTERLASGDALAAAAVEDARWVVAVSRIPRAEQRVALGTRALERTLSVVQVKGEAWPEVTERYLLAPWLRLQRLRWAQAMCLNARTGVWKTHGRSGPFAKMVEDLVWPRDEKDSSVSYWSATGLTRLELYFGPLATSIAVERPEHRLVREAITVLREPKAATAWLDEQGRLFVRLLERAERCRNAVIHGQQPSLGSLGTVDGFVRDLGRLVAQESMRSAQTEQVPLVELERWRNELADQRSRFEAGERPLDVWFADE